LLGAFFKLSSQFFKIIGYLKKLQTKDETAFECAKREFFEESSIDVEIALFENYFEQINIDKDVGIWLVNSENIEEMDKYFNGDVLKSNYLSWENSKVKFFSLNNLPRIKNKQLNLITEIKDFLQNKNQRH
jgi:ADP-ribose pyrophosphatase YjhB (NUDIX family)